MASTTSALLELELQTATENLATWGAKANTAKLLLEDGIAGTTAITVTGGSRTLSDTDQESNESRRATLKISGALTSNQTIVIPNRTKAYSVWNATTGSYTLTIATASPSSSATVTQGATVELYCDGSNNVWWLSPEANRTTGATISSVSGTSAANVSFSAFGNTSSTNVQDAIEELQADLDLLDLTTKQAASARLTEIAQVSPTLGTMLVSTGTGWTALSAGTTGYQLQADSAQSTGVKWALPEIDGYNKTKGRIWVGSGSTTYPIEVGSDGQVLVADSTAGMGVAWSTAGISSDTVTNAMLANVATKTVKGRTASGTGDPTDLTMAQLATMITADATALATLVAAIDGFSAADDIRGTTESGTITVPAGWTTYALLGFLHGTANETDADSVWRSSITRTLEPTQTIEDYYDGEGAVAAGFLVAIKVT